MPTIPKIDSQRVQERPISGGGMNLTINPDTYGAGKAWQYAAKSLTGIAQKQVEMQVKQMEAEDKESATKLNVLFRPQATAEFEKAQRGTSKDDDGKTIRTSSALSKQLGQMAMKLPDSLTEEQKEQLFPNGISDRAKKLYLEKSISQQLRIEDHAIRYFSDKRTADSIATNISDIRSMANDTSQSAYDNSHDIVKKSAKLRSNNYAQDRIQKLLNTEIKNAVNNEISGLLVKGDFIGAERVLEENKDMISAKGGRKYGISKDDYRQISDRIKATKVHDLKNQDQQVKDTFKREVATNAVNPISEEMSAAVQKEVKSVSDTLILQEIVNAPSGSITKGRLPEIKLQMGKDLRMILETTFGERRWYPTSENHIYEFKGEENRVKRDYLRGLPLKLLKEAIQVARGEVTFKTVTDEATGISKIEKKTKEVGRLKRDQNVGIDEIKEYVNKKFKNYLDGDFRAFVDKLREEKKAPPFSDEQWSKYRITDKVQKNARQRFYTNEYSY